MGPLQHQIKQGEVYRRSDLELYSSAIDRELAQLTNAGRLVKLSQGLYYSPLHSKFGAVPPDDQKLVAKVLKNENFLMVSPNAFNSLGLGLTQLYNTVWVYNHKKVGEFRYQDKSIEFKRRSVFPKTVTQEFLLVDLLDGIEQLTEDPDMVLSNLRNNIAGWYSPALLAAAQQYGSGKTRKLIRSLVSTDH